MSKYGPTFFQKSFSLALAAAIALSAAGCSGSGAHTTTAPSDAPRASTETAAAPADSSADAGAGNTSASAAAATAAAEETAAAATAAAADTAATSAAADTAATSAVADTAATAAAAGETAAAASTSAAASEDAAADAMDDGIPKRDTEDTALKESILSRALVECTGWGQSAGSSLRAATAAVMLLQWANEAEAGSADPALLADTVQAEVSRLSDAQQENLKINWSFVSYNASTILDNYDEVKGIMEDAGCAGAAEEAAANPNVLANWEALEHALDAALK